MSLKEEFKHEMKNIMKDVEKEVSKTWKINYKGHSIVIINEIKEEKLIIDGVTVDENKRKSVFSHIVPYSKLSGLLELSDGTKHKVSVKIGGYVKLNCIVKVDKEIIFNDSMKLEFNPWEHKEKIVSYIQQQVQEHGKIDDDYLPDEDYVYAEGQLRFAAGFSDQLVDEIPTPFFAKKLVKLFGEQINNPTTKTRKSTYESIISDNIASYGNEFIARFQEAQVDEDLVQKEALWLLEHAAHREVVKFAIIVLGCTNCEKYKDLLFTIGMHEEFTSYVLFALQDGSAQANEEIWQLAKSLQGWGKIAAVEELEPRTEEIKYWLLTKGCENTIMNEYLASTCAIKGELDIALYEEEISKDLYDGAGVIVEALLSEESPHEGIDDYPYASSVLSRFVHHAYTHCKELKDFIPIMEICRFLDQDKEVWEERFNDQWKRYEYDSIKEAIQPLINDSKWSREAAEALQQGFDYQAFEVASFYQLDVAMNLFKLLEKFPMDSELYLAIMNTDNLQYITELCRFAQKNFSLLNLSDDEKVCLQCIVQDLHKFEGIGLPLIEAALESNNEGLQYHALVALDAWQLPLAKYPSIKTAVKNIAAVSKDKEHRQLVKQILKND